MEFLTDERCRELCEDHGASETVQSNGCGPPFSFSLEVACPTLALEIVGVVLELCSALHVENGTHLLWLRKWGMWNEEMERFGATMWERLVGGMGSKTPSLRSARGAVFNSTESDDLQALLVMILTFQWDGVVMPVAGDWVLIVSHDEFIRVAAKSEARLEDLEKALHYLNPRRVT